MPKVASVAVLRGIAFVVMHREVGKFAKTC
jgi:hypothetical protein